MISSTSFATRDVLPTPGIPTITTFLLSTKPSTKSGFYPGLPNYVIQIIQPNNFIAITASPDEIHDRRMKDKTRNRDPVSIEDIKKELAVQDAMLSSCSVLSGSPMKVVFNHEGKVEEAAKSVLDAIGL